MSAEKTTSAKLVLVVETIIELMEVRSVKTEMEVQVVVVVFGIRKEDNPKMLYFVSVSCL
jgi:hypothetical protein